MFYHIKPILFTILVVTIFSVAIQTESHAQLDESTVNLNWITAAAHFNYMMDADDDGTIDSLLISTLHNGTITFDRLHGTGPAQMFLTLPAGDLPYGANLIGDELYIVTGNTVGDTCNFTLNSINLNTGVEQGGGVGEYSYSIDLGEPVDILNAAPYEYLGEPTMGMNCIATDGNPHEMEIYNPVHGVLASDNWGVATVNAIEGTSFYGSASGVSDGLIWYNDNYTEPAGTSIDGEYSYNNCLSAANVYCIIEEPGGDLGERLMLNHMDPAYMPNENTILGNNIKTFVGGFDMTQTDGAPTLRTGLSSYIANPENRLDALAMLHPSILGLDGAPLGRYVHPYDDGTQKLLVSPTHTGNLQYANVDELHDENRAIDMFVIDEPVTDKWLDTALTGLSSISGDYTISGPGLTESTTNHAGGALVSGYSVQSNEVLGRQFAPFETTSLDTKIWYGEGTTGVNLIVNIANAPSNSAYYVGLAELENGLEYVYSQNILTADNQFTVDLPASTCVRVYIKDLDLQTDWEYLGQLCNTGTMPKEIPYLSSLAFTFWSLEWGVDSKYNQESQTFETLVRNDNPYSYFIDIYDSTDTLIESSLYDVPLGGVDVQSFDTSSYSLPARAVYLSASNGTLYTTTVGFPGYLSAVAAQWGDLFTIDGFNLLFMIPIVFAAMFTRNSVSIGTGMTVMFMAALVWFGVLTIPEPVIYLMIFVAIIGMVAYKARS